MKRWIGRESKLGQAAILAGILLYESGGKHLEQPAFCISVMQRFFTLVLQLVRI